MKGRVWVVVLPEFNNQTVSLFGRPASLSGYVYFKYFSIITELLLLKTEVKFHFTLFSIFIFIDTVRLKNIGRSFK